MNLARQKALVDVEELDNETRSVPLSVDAIMVSVDTAREGLELAFKGQVDPTDRVSLLASAERLIQASVSLREAAAQLDGHARQLHAAGWIASHRAPLPKRPATKKRRR